MKFSLDEVHPSWHPLFTQHLTELNQILSEIEKLDIAPIRAQVFHAFRAPRENVKVLLVGQDPYPTPGRADGLAFSVSNSAGALPASLRNIFREYSDDLGFTSPLSGDLSAWSEQGVMLLNRSLTTVVGERNAHVKLGWKEFTDAVAQDLGPLNVIAILWGAHAQELSSYFTHTVESVHPSPLSAYRGFFGSKPFSKVNELLVSRGSIPIDWKL